MSAVRLVAGTGSEEAAGSASEHSTEASRGVSVEPFVARGPAGEAGLGLRLEF